jgi:hypothetical protein
LASGWDSPNLQKIIIIDPGHAIISKRVKTHLRLPKKIKIHGYHPAKLTEMIDHSES